MELACTQQSTETQTLRFLAKGNFRAGTLCEVAVLSVNPFCREVVHGRPGPASAEKLTKHELRHTQGHKVSFSGGPLEIGTAVVPAPPGFSQPVAT